MVSEDGFDFFPDPTLMLSSFVLSVCAGAICVCVFSAFSAASSGEEEVLPHDNPRTELEDFKAAGFLEATT